MKIAIKLIKRGLSNENIAEDRGLTTNQIEELRKKNKAAHNIRVVGK